MQRGGDLYEQEEQSFRAVEAVAEDAVEKWARSLSCPVIRIDGTKPTAENVDLIIRQL